MRKSDGRRIRRSFEGRRIHGTGAGAAPARTVLRSVTLLALPLALVALWSAPAFAHARLLQAEPADGATVTESPDRVALRFSEPVEAEFDPVEVLDSRGERVDGGDARVSPDDARVVEAGLGGLSEGAYAVEWRVTSIDGHVVEGEYGFEVAASGRSSAGGGGEELGGIGADDAAPAPAPQPASQAGPEDGATPVAAYAFASLGVLAVAVLAVAGAGAVRRRKPRRGPRRESRP